MAASTNDATIICLMAVVLLCVAFSLDLAQVIFVLLGGGVYMLLQMTRIGLPLQHPKSAPRVKSPPPHVPRARSHWPPNAQAPAVMQPAQPSPRCTARTVPTVRPVVRPALVSVGFAAQVDEFLVQITPTPHDDRVAHDIACMVQKLVRRKIPGACAVGIANGRVGGGTAFGVAVPEVEIAVAADEEALRRAVGGGASERAAVDGTDRLRRQQKAALRFCTQELVSSGAFRFRRSSFRSAEPKVTLVTPTSLGVCDQAVPIDVFVNSDTPANHAALLLECGRIDPRAADLAVLVRRWAKDRGICHVARGHLPPYAWTLLAIFYLQAGAEDEGPLLPALRLRRGRGPPPERPPAGAAGELPLPGARRSSSVGSLFKGLVAFYARDAEWCKGAVAVHLGRRVALPESAGRGIVWHDDGRLEVVPTIQDPFAPGRNVAALTSAAGMERLRQELSRARDLLARGAELPELLEPWAPEREGRED